MESGHFIFSDACQGLGPTKVAGEWNDYLKGQCIVLILAFPAAALVFWITGLICNCCSR
jgi:hypothetical protein